LKIFGNESYCQNVGITLDTCSGEDWEFFDSNTIALQHNNTEIPSIGHGSQFVNGVNFNGTFNITDGDDDFVGFVFGYEDPSHFYVVYSSALNEWLEQLHR